MKYFKLYANCKPVSGASESVIMDLQREYFIPIPNLLFDVLKVSENLTIEETKQAFKNEYDDGIDTYYQYLESLEVGHFTNDPHLFPPVDFTYYAPYKLISCVICITDTSEFNLTKIFNQLDKLGCQIIQLRVFHKADLIELQKHLNALSKSRVRVIELFLKHYNYSEELLNQLINKNIRLKITIHSAKGEEIKNHRRLSYTSKKIDLTGTEAYSVQHMVSNISFFTEALVKNVGLHKKISIDHKGNIKNYISHSDSFGNIEKDLLSEIIQKESFNKKGNIPNDRIVKCKSCQYRYMCLSNSDIIEKENQFYKLDHCGFDPFTNTWNNN